MRFNGTYKKPQGGHGDLGFVTRLPWELLAPTHTPLLPPPQNSPPNRPFPCNRNSPHSLHPVLLFTQSYHHHPSLQQQPARPPTYCPRLWGRNDAHLHGAVVPGGLRRGPGGRVRRLAALAGLRGEHVHRAARGRRRLLLPAGPRRAGHRRRRPVRRARPGAHPLPRRRRAVHGRRADRRGLRQDPPRPAPRRRGGRGRGRRRQRGEAAGRQAQAGVFRQDAHAVRRQQRRRLLRAAVLRRDHLPGAGLQRGAARAEHLRQGRAQGGVQVPAHLPGHTAPAPAHHRVEQLRQPEEAPRRRLHRVPAQRGRRGPRRHPPRQARLLHRRRTLRVGPLQRPGAGQCGLRRRRRQGEGPRRGRGGGGEAGRHRAAVRGGVLPAGEHPGVLRARGRGAGGHAGAVVPRHAVQDGVRDRGLVADQLVLGHRRRPPRRRPHPVAALALAAPPGDLGRAGPPPEREARMPVAGGAGVQHAQPAPAVLLAAAQEAADPVLRGLPLRRAALPPAAAAVRSQPPPPPRPAADAPQLPRFPLPGQQWCSSRRRTGSQACAPIRSVFSGSPRQQPAVGPTLPRRPAPGRRPRRPSRGKGQHRPDDRHVARPRRRRDLHSAEEGCQAAAAAAAADAAALRAGDTDGGADEIWRRDGGLAGRSRLAQVGGREGVQRLRRRLRVRRDPGQPEQQQQHVLLEAAVVRGQQQPVVLGAARAGARAVQGVRGVGRRGPQPGPLGADLVRGAVRPHVRHVRHRRRRPAEPRDVPQRRRRSQARRRRAFQGVREIGPEADDPDGRRQRQHRELESNEWLSRRIT